WGLHLLILTLRPSVSLRYHCNFEGIRNPLGHTRRNVPQSLGSDSKADLWLRLEASGGLRRLPRLRHSDSLQDFSVLAVNLHLVAVKEPNSGNAAAHEQAAGDRSLLHETRLVYCLLAVATKFLQGINGDLAGDLSMVHVEASSG